MKLSKWHRLRIMFDNALMSIHQPLAWLDMLGGIRAHGRLARFEWKRGPVAYDVEALLRRYHIHSYGRGVWIDIETDGDGNEEEVWRRWFYVNAEQSDWAEYLLLAGSVPLTDVRNRSNVQAWGKGRPVSWDERKGRRGLPRATLIEALADFIVGLTR